MLFFCFFVHGYLRYAALAPLLTSGATRLWAIRPYGSFIFLRIHIMKRPRLYGIGMIFGCLLAIQACQKDEQPNREQPSALPCDKAFVNSCADETHLQTCFNGYVKTTPCRDGWHCTTLPQGATCHPNDSYICSNGEKRCSTDDEILVCDSQSWKKTGTICEYGCLEGQCLNENKSFDYHCDEGKKICDGFGYILTCSQDKWQMSESPCPYRCQNGKCIEKPKINCTPEQCKGTCQNDICITHDMDQMQIGEECDPDTFIEFCRNNSTIACQYQNGSTAHIVTQDCSSLGGCSVVLHEDASQKQRLRAFCRGNQADQCTNVGQKIFHCTTSENSSLGEYYHETYQECTLNTDGSFTLLNSTDASLFGYCSDKGCDPQKEHCIELKELYYCEYHHRCTDSSGFDYCIDRGINGIHTGHEVCTNGRTCASVQGVEDCYDKCTEEGRRRSICQNQTDSAIQYTFTCIKGQDNQLYDVISSEVCPAGCNAGGTACAADTTCSQNNHDTCLDDILISCLDGTQKTYNCQEDGKNIHCIQTGDSAVCAQTCTKANDIQNTCISSGFESISIEKKCIKDTWGNLVLQTIKEDKCPGLCDVNGTTCAKNSTYPACTEKQLKECQTNYHPSYRCALDSQNIPHCLAACENADETTAFCFQKEGGDQVEGNNLFYKQTQCRTLSDGSNATIVIETQCPKACDDDKGCVEA